MLALIIIGSVLLGLAIISTLLVLLVRFALQNNNLRIARLIVGLLALQFILGMLANLFASIPSYQPWRVFHYVGPIALHTFNGLCLLILACIFLRNALKTYQSIRQAVGGLICIVVAFASGTIFVNAGQNNVFSFIMALGFLGALLAYCSVAMRRTSGSGSRLAHTPKHKQ